MTIYDEIKGHLERMPKARERAKKNAFLAWLLERKFDASLGLGIDALEKLIVLAASYDRAWRQVLEHEPQLRGSDYGEKEAVEQAKELELGYEPRFHENKKKLQNL